MSWSFYGLRDGAFRDRLVIGDVETAAMNCPAGCAAIEGVFDRMRQRVDLETGTVVDWQPPAPADDDMQTWTWDEKMRRYVSAPTLAALKAARTAIVQSAIETQEAEQARPLRECALALLAATPVDADARTQLAGVDARIKALRAVAQQIADAADEAALDQITLP